MKKVLLTGFILSVTSLALAQAMTATNNDSVMMKKENTDTAMKVDMMKVDTMKAGVMKKDSMLDKATMAQSDTTMYTKVSSSSKKEDITKLQRMLVEKGYLSMPKDVSYGYYGMRTKVAFKKYISASMMMKDVKNADTTMKATDTMMQQR